MRTREEAERLFGSLYGGMSATRDQNKLVLEILLDIRDLLTDKNEYTMIAGKIYDKNTGEEVTDKPTEEKSKLQLSSITLEGKCGMCDNFEPHWHKGGIGYKMVAPPKPKVELPEEIDLIGGDYSPRKTLNQIIRYLKSRE